MLALTYRFTIFEPANNIDDFKFKSLIFAYIHFCTQPMRNYYLNCRYFQLFNIYDGCLFWLL